MDALLELALESGSSQAIKRLLPVLAEDLTGPVGWSLLSVKVLKATFKHFEEAALIELQGKLKCPHVELCKLDGPLATFRDVVIRQGCGFQFNGAYLWHPTWNLDLHGFAHDIYRFDPRTKKVGIYPSAHTCACKVCPVHDS